MVGGLVVGELAHTEREGGSQSALGKVAESGDGTPLCLLLLLELVPSPHLTALESAPET